MLPNNILKQLKTVSKIYMKTLWYSLFTWWFSYTLRRFYLHYVCIFREQLYTHKKFSLQYFFELGKYSFFMEWCLFHNIHIVLDIRRKSTYYKSNETAISIITSCTYLKQIKYVMLTSKNFLRQLINTNECILCFYVICSVWY